MLPLIGILIVVAGFALRLNPLLVVTTAALATGLAAGHVLLLDRSLKAAYECERAIMYLFVYQR